MAMRVWERTGGSRRGLARCAAAAVLFGLSTPAASRLARHLDGLPLAGFLYLGAALGVAPFALARRPTVTAVRASAPRLAIAVVLGGAVGPVLLAFGLRDLPAATASLLLNLELVFTGVLAYVLFREYLGAWLVAGTALVVGAGAVLGWSGAAELRTGAVLVVAACVCWSVDNTVTAHLETLAPVHITLTKGAIAGSANLAIGLATGGAMPWRYALLAMVVGAFGYGASITLWVAGAREIGAARGQLVFACAPFVGAVAAWTVLGEPVLGRQVLALVVAMTGVALVLQSGHEHTHVHDMHEHDHEHDHDDGHHEHHERAVMGRHQHAHRHEPVAHDHGHMPDLHHRHEHEDDA